MQIGILGGKNPYKNYVVTWDTHWGLILRMVHAVFDHAGGQNFSHAQI